MKVSDFKKQSLNDTGYDRYVYSLNAGKATPLFNITSINHLRSEISEPLSKPHKHDVFIILWFSSGQGIYRVDDNDFTIVPDRIFFLNPLSFHAFIDSDDSNGRVITFSESFLNLFPYRLMEHIRYDLFCRQDGCAWCEIPNDRKRMLKALVQIMQDESSNASGYGHHFLLASYLINFVIQAERYCKWNLQVQHRAESKSHQKYLDFLSLVEKEFKRQKSISWYAGELGISVVLLSRYVKMHNRSSSSKVTPLKVISRRIMAEAQRLLSSSDLNVEQISDGLGFKDSSNFSKFFKREDKFGRTPSQYRKDFRTHD